MKLLQVIERLAVAVGCVALAALVATITVSVAGRYFFGTPVPDDLVISEFLMVFVVFLPLAAVQARREHVFVSLFTDWMPERARATLDTIGIILGFAMFTVVAGAAFTDFFAAWNVGAYADGPLKLPEAPARFAVFFGVALFAVRLFVDAIVSVAGIVSGRIKAATPGSSRNIEPLE